MTVETFRKKVHDPSSDEEWCPKRKIKKLSPQVSCVSPSSAQLALNNPEIVSKVCDYLLNGNKVVHFIDLRRINRTFDFTVLHFVRKAFRHLQIVDTNTNNFELEINEIDIKLVLVPSFFQFLRNVAKVRIETIEFAGFLDSNKEVHDCILRELFSFDVMQIRKFVGAEEICERGCMMCHALASISKSYGPMQWLTLHQGFSYRLMFSATTGTHPRNVIDCIIKQWKLKSLEIELMEADAIADCLIAKAMWSQDIHIGYSLQNVCANVKRVFPSDRVFLTLPLGMHDLARERFGDFCEIVVSFVWNDELNARNSTCFVRVYCYGIKTQDVQKSVLPMYEFNGRPIISNVNSLALDVEIRGLLSNWHHHSNMRNFSPIAVVSLYDVLNKCAIHIQVCVDPE
ncbi:unnamed protein product [Caenorhabditis bovis]|uniref:Uncharacterized protein n=1 Tax=Caenorhabditis bovis TaxID=2654633 RepID=A0A8S1FD75_9PELO|nr:unnamed protein product [Caenorhabditis bovis]